jgi:class 3 adenylate cyclase
MQTSTPTEIGPARELELTLLITDLSGYTALTETHGALHASAVVLRFQRLAEASLEPGVAIVNSIGDDVFCAGPDTLAVVRTALRLRDSVAREPEYPKVRTGVHRGLIVEREGKFFGAPINLTARIAAHANGGQILCTAPIADAVSAMTGIEPRPMGERRFRNVPYAVAVFELVRANERRAVAFIDPVCRMQVDADRAAATIAYGEISYRFCSLRCARDFANAPENFIEVGGKGRSA